MYTNMQALFLLLLNPMFSITVTFDGIKNGFIKKFELWYNWNLIKYSFSLEKQDFSRI